MNNVKVLYERLRASPWPVLVPNVGHCALYESLLAGCADRMARGAPVDVDKIPEPDEQCFVNRILMTNYYKSGSTSGGLLMKYLCKVLAGCAALFATSTIQASDISCGGPISVLMVDYPMCNGNVAFKTTATGGPSGVWMCSKSKGASALLIAAQFAGKEVAVYIEGSDVSGCATLPHYRNVSYIITYP